MHLTIVVRFVCCYSALFICSCNILLLKKIGNREFQEGRVEKQVAASTYKELGYAL